MSKKEQKLEFEHATIYQTNENCQVFTGPISGAIFAMPGSTVHQHVGNAEKEAEATEADEGYEYVDFVFFADKRLTTLEEQNVLRRVLKGVLSRMDVDSGRDWVAPYIAYHYFIGREFLMKGYVDFFTDIEGLLPGVLTKVNADETGDKRYKAYTDLLRAECANWFILDDCLPPLLEWTSNRFTYHVDDTRRKRIQGIVKDIYQGLQKGI